MQFPQPGWCLDVTPLPGWCLDAQRAPDEDDEDADEDDDDEDADAGSSRPQVGFRNDQFMCSCYGVISSPVERDRVLEYARAF